VVTETRTVEVPVEVVKPLPESLTTPLSYPTLGDGEITVDALLDLVFDFYDLLDVANADREDAAELTQPSPDIPQ
jgi:hypothetical protein